MQAPATVSRLDASFFSDPYPTYAAWQAQGPVLHSEDFFGGAWLLTRYDDVAWALKDEAGLSARRTGGWLNRTSEMARRRLAPFQQLFARAMLFLDPPDHGRLRQLLAPGFRPAFWHGLGGRIAHQVDTWLDALDPSRPFDFMATIACPLPAKVVAGLMGIDDGQSGTADFMACSDDIAAFLGHPDPDLALAQRAQRGALALAEMFQRELAARRRRGALKESGGEDEAPGDWLALLLRAEARGLIASTEELLAQCVMLLFAGHETTRHLLGNGLHALITHPGAWRALRRDPSLLPSALRELLRFDSPVQYTGRRVAHTMSLHGQTLRRGDLVLPLIGAANRDPRRYSVPERLQLDRKEAMHLSFGAGAHACIGAALTYLEAQSVFQTLLRRWGDAPPSLAAEPMRQANPLYRGFEHLVLQP